MTNSAQTFTFTYNADEMVWWSKAPSQTQFSRTAKFNPGHLHQPVTLMSLSGQDAKKQTEVSQGRQVLTGESINFPQKPG